MTRVLVWQQILIVEPEGLDKFWSFMWRLHVPLAAITSATVEGYTAARVVFGLRFPGTYIPGVIKAGTFYESGEHEFWLVRQARQVIVIELANQRYARLVLQVPDPNALVHTIYSAIRNSVST